MITVIIPTYNRGTTVIKSIQSVQNQTYENWELIIVDDGSTDNTETTVSPYLTDKRIRYIKKDNGGPGSARNLGMKHAKDDLISFLDSDDQYHPTFLERSFKVMEQLAPNYGFIWTGVRFCMSNGQYQNHIWNPSFETSKAALNQFLVKRKIGTGHGITIRKNILEDVGFFDKNMRAVEDTEFFIRILKIYNCYSVDDILVDVARSDDDRLNVPNIKKVDAFKHILEKHKDVIPINSKPYHNFNFQILSIYAKLGMNTTAFKYSIDLMIQSKNLKFPILAIVYFLKYGYKKN